MDALLTNTNDILPSDRVIIEGLRDGGTTLNEDILCRIFKDAKNESKAIYKVASDTARMCAEQKKSNAL
jgi:cytidylate kinase